MDEQAGPGVFFNNNNNSVLPGGGKGPLADGDAGEAARAHYSIPGILHFLQHEWARFEVERAQWEVERAELQVKKTHHILYSSRIGDITLRTSASFSYGTDFQYLIIRITMLTC